MSEIDLAYDLRGVTKVFRGPISLGRGARSGIRAVDGINLTVTRGEAVGLVGESGSGKSTFGRIMAGLESASEGHTLWKGREVRDLRGKYRRGFHYEVQLIHQNPFASLNPKRTVRDVLTSGRALRRIPRGSERNSAMERLLEQVGMHPEMLDRYPHEFSGGQRQRIVIARALSTAPEILVADEPVSALDVSIQAQVLNLLKDLRESMGLTLIFITHDLRVANFVSDRIAVMYSGQIMEIGPRWEVIQRPTHPYTRMLMASAPMSTSPGVSRPEIVAAEAIREGDLRRGCVFANRCGLRMKLGTPSECLEERPTLKKVGAETTVACHFPGGDEEMKGLASAPEGERVGDGLR